MVTVPKALNAVAAACRAHPFHPVRNYLDSLRWDGKPRIERWLTYYVGAEDNDYHRAVGPRWLIGAVARIYQPGCMLRTALVLEGPQELRKSTTAAVLGGAWFTDTPQDLRSKDAMQDLQGVWIIELAELAALGTAGQDRIKAFMSSGTDRFRPAFGRLVQAHPRQCAFIGTVNPDGTGYLKDPTGGSRFWPVRCGPHIDIEALRHDRDQLWAEAVHRYRAGVRWHLETAELAALAKDQADDRYAEDARAPLVAAYVADKDSVSLPEVIENAMPVGDRDRWGQKTQNLIARALIQLGWSRRKVGSRGAREWRYFAPARGEG
jgi:putative DNA primase/helicase